MKLLFLSAGLLIVSVGNVQADTLYRWTDKAGKVHYGDRPAEDAVRTEAKKFAAPRPADDDDLSYTTRKAKQDFPVTFYVAPNCGEPCVRARAFLNKRGIPFVEKNLLTKEDGEAFKAKTGGNSVPSLTVGRAVLSGFEAGQWNSELDIAGYPKFAEYGKRPVQPATAKPAAAKPATAKPEIQTEPAADAETRTESETTPEASQ